MKRFPNWQALLEAEVRASRSKRFQWGVFDCALFACDCILAMTGVDPAADFRGKYSTEEEARALIGDDLEATACAIASALAMPLVHPASFAQRGDLVLCANPHNPPALGIIDSSGRAALCASDLGIALVPMKRWLLVWGVGGA